MIGQVRTAYSYIRFSRLEQIRGDSLRRQLQAGQAYADRHSLCLDSTLRLRDLGVSAFRGRNAKEGALAAFLTAIDNGRVEPGSTLIVESLDRLSRSKVNEALELFLGILRRGVSIVTLTPERQYTNASIGDITGLLEPLIVMARANEESEIKSSRLKSAWTQKRRTTGDKKMTRACPAWLDLSEDRKRFIVIKESAAVVKRIFRLAIRGYGTTAISKLLNEEQVPTIGRRVNSTTWHKSYVSKILKSRAVLGEFQSHVYKDGKRVPSGDIISDYFPAIIKEPDFYKAQQALQSRRNQTSGPKGDFVNVLIGLVHDANDGSPMVIVNKGSRSSGRALVSAKAQRGEPGAVYASIPYVQVERAVLAWQSELRLEDLLSEKNGNKLADEIERLEGRLAKLSVKIDKVERQLRDDDDEDTFEALIGLRKQLQKDRKTLKHDLEDKKTELSNQVGSRTLKETKSIIKKLNSLDGEELQDLRLRLRSHLNLMIEDIRCEVVKVSHVKRGARLTIKLKSGKKCPPIDAPPLS